MLKIICSAVIHRPSARDSLLYTIEEHVPFGSVSLAKGCDRRRSSTEETSFKRGLVHRVNWANVPPTVLCVAIH